MAELWSDVRVRVEFSLAHELAISLFAFVDKSTHTTIDLGPQWAKQVRQSLSPEFAKRLGQAGVRDLIHSFPLVAIVDKAPAEKGSESFTTWMRSMASGEIYDFLTTHHILDGPDISSAVDNWCKVASLLDEWNVQYFQSVSPVILEALADDAVEKRRLAETVAPDALVHQAAIGLDLQLEEHLNEVVLIPQYHFCPWNVSHWSGDTWYNQYPMERAFDGRDIAFDQLVRMSRALADESRLRLLQALAKGPARFSELVEASDVTKSTVHHHLVTLRAARLVIVRLAPLQRQTLYALNPNLADDAKDLLQRVLGLGG